MLTEYWHCGRAVWRFRGYEPQPVTPRSFMRWLRQYPNDVDRGYLIELLDRVQFIGNREMRTVLFNLNRRLMKRLRKDEIPADHLIYLQIHDAGSSSPVVLNMLRNVGQLEHRNCRLIDGSNAKALNETTDELENGAVVYVDDFLGTGSQFEQVRQFLAPYIVGNFPEFVLAPAMSEEAIHLLGRLGVEPVTQFVHAKVDRPLHESSSVFDDGAQDRLTKLCFDIDPMFGLGFGSLATMIVFYSGSPDTVPRVLRGSPNQTPMCGILPAYSDLPIIE
jgi:hypothetical protein